MSIVVRRDVVEGTEDIVKFLRSYKDDDYFINTMYWTLQLVRNDNHVRPAEVYIALLESGNVKQCGDVSGMCAYNKCIFYMGLLEPLGIFRCHIVDMENGQQLITAHTAFSRIVGPRFIVFANYLQELYNASNAKRYITKSYTVKSLQEYVAAFQEPIEEAEPTDTGSKINAKVKAGLVRVATQAQEPVDLKRVDPEPVDLKRVDPEPVDPMRAALREKWREQKKKQRVKKELAEKLKVIQK